jgi:hypothetical protein
LNVEPNRQSCNNVGSTRIRHVAVPEAARFGAARKQAASAAKFETIRFLDRQGTPSMGLDRGILERQLKLASAELLGCEGTLEAKGITGDARKRNPTWRSLNAKCRQIKRRLRSVEALEKLDEELQQRKAEKASVGAEDED